MRNRPQRGPSHEITAAENILLDVKPHINEAITELEAQGWTPRGGGR